MKTQKQIEIRYKKLHNKLSESYYAGTSGLSKEEFNRQHGKIWSDMEVELIEGGFISPPIPPGPTLEDRIAALEAKVYD